MGEQARGGCCCYCGGGHGDPVTRPPGLLLLQRGVYPPHAHGAFYCSEAYPLPVNTCSCCRGDKPPSATARLLLLQGGGDPPLLYCGGGYTPLYKFPTATATTGGVTRCALFSRFSNVAPVYISRFRSRKIQISNLKIQRSKTQGILTS